MPKALVSGKGCAPLRRKLCGRLWFTCVLAVLGTAPARAQAPVSEIVLHSFPGFPLGGEEPSGNVSRDSAGNFYGTTAVGGGCLSCGVVFKVDTMGRETALHIFRGGADGKNPTGVAVDSAGNVYGTTNEGGKDNDGVLYKVDATGHETLLHTFQGGTDGSYPYAGVTLDSAGNIYGTASAGGTATGVFGGCGVVFKVDAAGQYAVLYRFASNGSDGDGCNPDAGVVLDSAGNLYGTTSGGGTGTCYYGHCGVIYRLDSAGNYTVLFRFTGGADGSVPQAGVILDSAGNIYGTTSYGGTGVCSELGYQGCGVVYKLDTGGNYTVLHEFTGPDGSVPEAGVIADSAGNLYGTTSGGGTGLCSVNDLTGCGVVYELDATGNYTVLYGFTGGTDGGVPQAGVVLDSAGNLYGTASSGGNGTGVVYKLDATGQETVLFSFLTVPAGGSAPGSGVVGDSAGNLYGTTVFGGIGSCIDDLPGGCGVLYKLDSAGHYTVLHRFTGGADGGAPEAGVILDSAGNLYGTTNEGGPANAGVVYKLDAAGNFTVLHTFTGGAGGSGPQAGVIRDSEGNLYGTTAYGGIANAGVVYKLDTASQETVLYSFTGEADGFLPYAGVIRDSAGNLYGTTVAGGAGTLYDGFGVVYKLDAAGNYTVLHTFTGADGGNPYSGVILDSAGNLYGTTTYGGLDTGESYTGLGVVYKLNAAGNYTVLYAFTGVDGEAPFAGVILDSAGNLYGTAGGGEGVVYKLDASGNYTVVYAFTGRADGGDNGGSPGGVTRSPAGNLLGTVGGGIFGGGVVFALTGVQ